MLSEPSGEIDRLTLVDKAAAAPDAEEWTEVRRRKTRSMLDPPPPPIDHPSCYVTPQVVRVHGLQYILTLMRKPR